jgi:hypothetical protein
MLRQLPQFQQLEKELQVTRAALLAEKEGRDAALGAWEKAEKKVKQLESRTSQASADVEVKCKVRPPSPTARLSRDGWVCVRQQVLAEEKRVVERELQWAQDQLKRVVADMDGLREQLARTSSAVPARSSAVRPPPYVGLCAPQGARRSAQRSKYAWAA